MRTLKVFVVFLFVLGLAGFAWAVSEVPDKYQKEFLEHYKYFIDNDTRQAFEKLTTDVERDVFISNFWKERDTDPNTLENEYKEEIDQRFVDIQGEIFFRDSRLVGIRFEDNGGLNGDMAIVYLLHGTPNLKIKRFEGHNHVDIMLWVYLDETGRNPKYMFLFYRKYNVGPLQVFRNYSMYLERALAEISRTGSQDLNGTYEELEWMSGQEGRFILSALTEFSFDSSINVDEAMNPPKPASLTVREARSRIVGQPDIAEETEILYSKERSFIPADFKVHTITVVEVSKAKLIEIYLGIKYGDLDWVVDGDQLKCVMQLKLVFQNKQTKEVSFYSSPINLVISKMELDEKFNFYLDIPLQELADKINNNLLGSYGVGAYLKNVLTNKYNAWSEEVTK